MRFFVKRRNNTPDREQREDALSAAGTTPERLMAAITNAMGERCDNKEEFDELLLLLMYKAPDWVKQVAMIREQNIGAQIKRGEPPRPLIL